MSADPWADLSRETRLLTEALRKLKDVERRRNERERREEAMVVAGLVAALIGVTVGMVGSWLLVTAGWSFTSAVIASIVAALIPAYLAQWLIWRHLR